MNKFAMFDEFINKAIKKFTSCKTPYAFRKSTVLVPRNYLTVNWKKHELWLQRLDYLTAEHNQQYPDNKVCYDFTSTGERAKWAIFRITITPYITKENHGN